MQELALALLVYYKPRKLNPAVDLKSYKKNEEEKGTKSEPKSRCQC